MTTDLIIDFVTAFWLGFIGACIGSFLNVVAYRVPLGKSVVWESSHCPACNQPIRWHDNVPVFGWLWLRGRCRDCQAPISPRYAIVEFLMGLAFFILAYVELFTGGAPLPGGPITEKRGALFSVWYPNWPLIGFYAWHGLLIAVLMTHILFRRDKQITSKKLLVVALCIAGAWYGLPSMLLR